MAIGIGVKIGTAHSIAVAASETSWENTVSVETSTLAAVDDFVARVGDPVPMVDEQGNPVVAAAVYTDVAAQLVDALDIGSDADTHLTVVHPDGWSDQALHEVWEQIDEHPGLPAGEDVSWVPESRAALAAIEHSEGTFGDGTVVTYDLGATGLTVGVLRTGRDPDLVGRPLHVDTVSGREFDRLLLGHVLTITGEADALDAALLDAGDHPGVIDDLNDLRASCRSAKEALSVDTDTVVDVRLGQVHTEARVVRDDIEDLLRAPIMDSVSLVREALADAGVDPAGVSAILLTGGGAAIPLVSELVSSTLRLPVLVDPDPTSAVAAGGALIASSRLADREPSTTGLSTSVLPAAGPGERPLREIIPAPSTPMTEAAPRLSTRKRGTLITIGTAALILMTATALSVGTGLIGSTGEATPPPAGAATSTTAPNGTTTGVPNSEAARRPGAATTADGRAPGARPGASPADPRTTAGDSTTGRSPATGGPATGDRTPNQQTGTPTAPNTGSPAPGTGSPAPTQPSTNPPPEFPSSGGGNGGNTGGGNTGGGNTGGGTSGGGLLQVPGKVLEGTGNTVCAVTDLVCLKRNG